MTFLTVQAPSHLGDVQTLTSFANGINSYQYRPVALIATNLRAAMTSTSSTDPQSRLWSSPGAVNCTNMTASDNGACAFGQVALSNISALEDPFVAQLPAGYNTGLVRQFLPRINSSVSRERIDETQFPTNCSHDSIFFANWSTTAPDTQIGPSWHLIACMPGEPKSQPITVPSQRYDFSEELYLNLSARNPPVTDAVPVEDLSGLFKVTLRTTSGYFELPNYMNGKRPGPLFSDDPSKHCGRDCILQGDYYPV